MNLKVENFADREKGIMEYLDRNGEPGRSTGFRCLDDFYTIKDGGVTDWTGFPASGKSYLVFELLMTQAELYGKRTLLYVPDIGNYNEIWSKLMMMYSGKNFNSKYGNKINETDILKAKDWINFHFLILGKKDHKKSVSPIEFFEFVCDYKDDVGGVASGMIDSWKNFSHDFSGKREDLYLDEVLAQRNELSEKYLKHFHTIAHATKTEIDENNISTGANGNKKKKRRVPDANDIKGGGSWYANGKCIISVDFPDKSTNSLDLFVSKTKPEGVGKVGAILGEIKLDYSRHRFYEVVNGEKKFTFTKSNDKLTNNINFDEQKTNYITDGNPF